jgi:hypothetical protein
MGTETRLPGHSRPKTNLSHIGELDGRFQTAFAELATRGVHALGLHKTGLEQGGAEGNLSSRRGVRHAD